jgi:hypothetical protein
VEVREADSSSPCSAKIFEVCHDLVVISAQEKLLLKKIELVGTGQ